MNRDNDSVHVGIVSQCRANQLSSVKNSIGKCHVNKVWSNTDNKRGGVYANKDTQSANRINKKNSI